MNSVKIKFYDNKLINKSVGFKNLKPVLWSYFHDVAQLSIDYEQNPMPFASNFFNQ